jgi:DNA polymerase III epsilon subunit family exonuclease
MREETKFIKLLNKTLPDKYHIFTCSEAVITDNGGLVIILLVNAKDFDDKLSESLMNDVKEFAFETFSFLPNIEVKFKKTISEESFIIGEVSRYLYSEHHLLNSQLSEQDIQINPTPYGIDITIETTPSIKQLLLGADIDKNLSLILEKKLMEDISIIINDTKKPLVVKNRKLSIGSKAEKLIRLININQGTTFFGHITRQPVYISDINNITSKDSVVACGKVSSVNSKQISKDGRDYYITEFTINDSTDTLLCTRFSKSKDIQDSLDLFLSENQTVVVTGKLSQMFGNKSQHSLTVRGLAACTIDYGSISTEIPYKSVASDYSTVFPQPYNDYVQSNVFQMQKPDFDSNIYVVFDLETTGLDQTKDEIVEIGAVKMKNGLIVESFETLIKPQIPMPTEATKVNHIVDSMLENAPAFSEVIADFYKFCHECVLIAHNASFDLGMLTFHAKKYSYNFDHPVKDTMLLARKKLNITRGADLESLCKRFNISNTNAHRALSDAIATAKLFQKLMTLPN